MKRNFLIVFGIALLVAFLGARVGLSAHQAIAIGVFSFSVAGVLFFWDSRLSFVFFGAGILLITKVVDLENFIKFASLDVIIFLIGMMILVGMLNEAGLFLWIITRLLRVKNLTATKLFLYIMAISAVLSSIMDEATSIIVMTKIILDISDFFDIDPVPLLISSVFATNIGSSSTVLGNPIGVLIAARGNLAFEDFLTHALPIAFFILIATMIILILWFRKHIRTLNEKVRAIQENHFFLALISIPPERKVKVSVLIFAITLLAISLHRRLELFFNIEYNTLLLMIPIISAGIALFHRADRMRHYIMHEVEWPSLLFFLFLFAQAGVIKYSGISDFFAEKLLTGLSTRSQSLVGIILYSSGFFSSILDNTVVVASYIPMLQSLGALQVNLKPLWWALLFGACYGGNITVIGSTANIIAMGILEKKRKMTIGFFFWLKMGLVIGIFSMICAHILMSFFNF